MQITIREPGSAITHFIAMMLTVFAAAPLLVKSALSDTVNMLPAMTISVSYTHLDVYKRQHLYLLL